MASYINTPDYIPQIQPYHPDFNFYSAALERKEGQYKEGYNKISGLYGTMLNSPMLRDDNNERRDQFFKQVSNSIQKISGMDLSLEENVDSAYKVFQPIINDKSIHKDIVYTKNYQNELNRAEGFRNCVDEAKCGGKWWDEGVKALHYQADDFRKADPDSAMQMDNPRFTPYVNAYQKGLENAKKMGFNVSQTFSDGKYIHTYKNGTALEIPLRDYLMSTIGNDAGVQDMYKTKAYIQRKDFISQNAQQYGSEDAAENYYMESVLRAVDGKTNRSVQHLDRATSLITAKRDVLQERVDNKNTNDFQKSIQEIQSYNDQLEKADTAQAIHKNTLDHADRSVLVGADRRSTRWRVDNALANELMGADAARAAHDYSALHSEHKIEADPYGVNAQKHMYDLDSMKVKHGYDLETEEMKLAYKMQFTKQKLELDQRGGASENMPHDPIDLPGNYTKAGTYPNLEGFQKVMSQSTDIAKQSSGDYAKNVYNYYKGIIDDKTDTYSPQHKVVAQAALKEIFGDHLDPKTFELTGQPITAGQDWNTVYGRARDNVKKSGSLIDDSFKAKLAQTENTVDESWQMWGAYDKTMHGNNLAVKHYVNVEARGEEYSSEARDRFNMFIKDNGDLQTFDNWANMYASKYGVTDHNKLSSLYDDTYEAYKLIYNKDKLSNDPKYNVRAWDGSVVLGGQGGGKGARTLQYDNDGAHFKSVSTQGLLSVQKNLNALSPGDASTHTIFGGALGFADIKTVTNSEGSSGANAKAVFNAYVDDLKTQYKEGNKERPMGRVLYSDVAAGDPNMTAVTIIPNQEWIEKHRGSDKKPGITHNSVEGIDKLSNEGVTIMIPRDKANNVFSNSVKARKYDILLDQGPVPINYGKRTGQVVITKTDQGIRTTGTVYNYDARGNKVPQRIEATYPLDYGGNNLVEYIHKNMDALDKKNLQDEQILNEYASENP